MTDKPWRRDIPKWYEYVKHKLAVGNDDRELVCDLAELKEKSSNGTFIVFPDKVRFETQESDEQVVMTIRRAFITNFKWIFISFVLMISPLFIEAVGVFSNWMTGTQKVFVFIFWQIIITGYMIEQFLLWYYNIYIITDKRVVDLDFHNMLKRELNDADLLKIQDVTVKSRGVGSAIFHYGDILIQTAAAITVFEYHAVAYPEKIASVIRLLANNREKIDNPKNDRP